MNNRESREYKKARNIAETLLDQFDYDVEIWAVVSYMQDLLEHDKEETIV